VITVKDAENLGKERGKRSSEILAVKMEIFSETKRHSEILVREKKFRPLQTRRLVSANGTPNCL